MNEQTKEKPHIAKTPLLFLVPLTALLLSLFTLIDPLGSFRDYEVDLLTRPVFAKAMVAIKEKGLNLQDDPGEDLEASAAFDTKGEEDVRIGEDYTADLSGEEEQAEPEDGMDAKDPKAGDQDSPKEDGEQTLCLTIPPESTCPVCPATDYGTTAQRYLAPSDWEPIADTTGMFSTNGYYRPLESVEKEYFADALFIGDSRVDGLCDYGKIADQATFLSRDSITIHGIFNESMHYHDAQGGRGRKSLPETLAQMNYRKIYIQVGINEVGTGDTTSFYKDYRNLVMTLRSKQPLAIIYIQGIMHVTAGASSSSSVFSNKNIVEKNEAIASLANGRDIFYLDFNPAVCDENGNLRGDLSRDKAHLKASAYEKWTAFLMEHAADPDKSAVPVYESGESSEGGTLPLSDSSGKSEVRMGESTR